MARVRTARQRAASRRNLEKARRKRKGRVRSHLSRPHPKGKALNGKRLSYGKVYRNRALAGVAAATPLALAILASETGSGNNARRRKSQRHAKYGTTSRKQARHLKKTGWTGRRTGIRPGGKVYNAANKVTSHRGVSRPLYNHKALRR